MSPILLNVKSHKPDGQVDVRIIFSGSLHPFASIAKFLGHQLRQHLHCRKHLYGDTRSLIRQLTSITLQPGDKLVELDISDFFDRGKFNMLVGKSIHHIDPPMERAFLRKMLGCLLNAQFCNDRLNNQAYRVHRGSGQGLCISSDLANYVFDAVVEAPILDKPAFLESFDLRFYGRYVDNIFVVGHTKSIGRLLSLMRSLSQPTWAIKLEQCSSSSMTVLDATVSISYRSMRLLSVPHFKPQHSTRYLAHSSAHANGVHSSWPVAYCNRLRSLSSTTSAYYDAVRTFHRRLASNFVQVPLRSLLKSPTSLPARLRSSASLDVWVTLPYSAAVARSGISSALAALSSEWQSELKSIFKTDREVRFRISWHKGAQNIESFLRREFNV